MKNITQITKKQNKSQSKYTVNYDNCSQSLINHESRNEIVNIMESRRKDFNK